MTRDALRIAPSPAEMLVSALARYPDRIALYLTAGGHATYAEVAARISQVCQAYAAVGLKEGDRVAVLSANRPEVLYVQGANALARVTSTALHPLGSLDDHSFVLEDAGIDTLIYDPVFFQARAADLVARVPSMRRVLALGPAAVGTDLLSIANEFDPQPLVAPHPHPDALYALAYTGGTTGKPKGVMVTEASITYMTMIQMAEWQWPDEVRFLIATPLSHAGAAVVYPTLLHGGSLVVMQGFDPAAFFDAVATYRITATLLVPTLLYMLLDHPRAATADVSSLETVFYGASAASPARLAEAIERFGSIFFQFYGQSEAPMTLCVLRREEHVVTRPERLASCGRPVPWVRIQLRDDSGVEVGDGVPGEICVQAPLVTPAYWNRPEETADTLRGGWLHTGDIARRDSEGYLTIVDRAKDLIVSGGFNVFPREVEDVLAEHPAVAMAAVIGVPDDKWGEAVTAVVVLRPGAEVDADELIELVKQRKGALHAPKRVEFAESIPVSALGKPDKKALRARFWEDQQRAVH